MTDISKLTHADINWNQLWQNARNQRGWASKGAEDWDKKSSSFARRNKQSPYIELLLSQLPLNQEMSILDVGCGPGTLAIPLAKKCKKVTGIDFSSGMLALLNKEAESHQLHNIETIQCAWEDDWQQNGVAVHDITIASRSMGVADLTAAIEKLDGYARQYVFIVDRISPTPFDPAAFEAIGRSFSSGPDYIYTINCLYTMGIHPHVTILQLEKRLYFDSIEQALESYRWMFKDLTDHEDDQLKLYLQHNMTKSAGSQFAIEREPPRWALIWWHKNRD